MTNKLPYIKVEAEYKKNSGEMILNIHFWGVRGSIPAPLTPQQIQSKIMAAVQRIKPEDFQALEVRIKTKWIENTGSDKDFYETWRMIQSCISYGFCSSHAVATAIDCLYGAYLKVNYPLEYYTVALTNYADDMERTNKLISELPCFNIKLLHIKFGKSSSNDFIIDKLVLNKIYSPLSKNKSNI